ncbi:Acyl-[acyl-carrier-protein]--UDP-N- acetylglucosamine O-acyltransferase [Rickettsiales bacterium Ac37b]|nr:Acyl-[acyl-carrier-protein]--UDP-N- acetylglucosamine O-acyltransferase [Rickettsiales bacterium Ac37b]
MSNNIHPTAIIYPGAELANNVYVGPYSIVGKNVKLGENVVLKSHVVIEGHTEIGDNTEIFPFASIGHIPQDKKYKGETSRVIIGSNNIIREHVTINPGTVGGIMKTVIGNNCLLMVSCHVAHDCIIGDNVILVNNVTLGGHVVIGDYAILGGLSAVHQFVRIGAHAMIGGMASIESDVIPYGIALNERAYLSGINIVGLRRRNYDNETISSIQNVYEELFLHKDSSTFANKLKIAAEKYKDNANVMVMIDFLLQNTARSICKPKL